MRLSRQAPRATSGELSPETDDALHAATIEALYGTPFAVIYGMIIINGIVLSAYFLSGDPVILGLACILAVINGYRAWSHHAYNLRGRGCIHRPTQRYFERLACSGAWCTAATVGTFGGYTVVAHPYEAASILGVAQAMGYLAGVTGRNTSRPYITQVQMSLVSLPFVTGLVLSGSLAYLLIAIAVVFTLIATVSSVRSFYEVFLSRVKTMRRLEQLATRDILTGLANRYALLLKVEEWNRDGRVFSLISIDLDNFKDVNDHFGHHVGDDLLKAAAKRIARHFAAEDIVARVGGDEFMVLTPKTDTGLILNSATDVINDLALPFVVSNLRLRAGASVGVACASGFSAEEAFKAVDLALYQAKQAGKNQLCVYKPEFGERYDERIQLEQDLRRAIENGELSLAYQPIVNPQTRRVVLVEALMRWKHPDRGFISPAVFIPIAEASGLIAMLGTWALQSACLTAASWPTDIGVSVNLSAKQFRRDHDLVAIVKSCLDISGLAPERLTLEITESILIDDAELVVDTLSRLRKMGVQTALDDFGTGYSSLSYLAQLPLDKIKIDRAFATPMTSSARSTTLMRGIVTIARDLGLQVIAEGIETEDQLATLQGFGIDGVQGYVYAWPTDSVSLLRMLVHEIKPAGGVSDINQARRKQISNG